MTIFDLDLGNGVKFNSENLSLFWFLQAIQTKIDMDISKMQHVCEDGPYWVKTDEVAGDLKFSKNLSSIGKFFSKSVVSSQILKPLYVHVTWHIPSPRKNVGDLHCVGDR